LKKLCLSTSVEAISSKLAALAKAILALAALACSIVRVSGARSAWRWGVVKAATSTTAHLGGEGGSGAASG